MSLDTAPSESGKATAPSNRVRVAQRLAKPITPIEALLADGWLDTGHVAAVNRLLQDAAGATLAGLWQRLAGGTAMWRGVMATCGAVSIGAGKVVD
jgi:hypothetical protein